MFIHLFYANSWMILCISISCRHIPSTSKMRIFASPTKLPNLREEKIVDSKSQPKNLLNTYHDVMKIPGET